MKTRNIDSALVSLSELNPFQGDLKILTANNMKKLQKNMLANGFSYPFILCRVKGDGELKLIDGHQRLSALLDLQEKGKSKLPEKYPAIIIDAEDCEDAKKLTLSIASVFGTVNPEGARAFVESLGMTDKELEGMFDLPSFDFTIPADMDELEISSSGFEDGWGSEYVFRVELSEDERDRVFSAMNAMGYGDDEKAFLMRGLL